MIALLRMFVFRRWRVCHSLKPRVTHSLLGMGADGEVNMQTIAADAEPHLPTWWTRFSLEGKT